MRNFEGSVTWTAGAKLTESVLNQIAWAFVLSYYGTMSACRNAPYVEKLRRTHLDFDARVIDRVELLDPPVEYL